MAMTLGEYVLKRNGVPLGAKGSLPNNLRNSFGAGTNADFWRHWNPIWGYYLAKFIYLPLGNYVPRSLAILASFAVSGALHDLAVGLLGIAWQGFFTAWFLVMGLFLIVSKALQIDFSGLPFAFRALVNFASPAACLGVTVLLRGVLLPG